MSSKGGGGGEDSKSSKVLPTNNQIYLTLPPLLGQMGGGGHKYLWGRGEEGFLLEPVSSGNTKNPIALAIPRPALGFLLACGVLWGSVGREIETWT